MTSRDNAIHRKWVFSHLILAFFKFLLHKSKSREGIFDPVSGERLRLSGTTHKAMLFLKAKALKSLTRETSAETKLPAGHALSLPPITAGKAPRSSALANQLRGSRRRRGGASVSREAAGRLLATLGSSVARLWPPPPVLVTPQLLPRAPCPPFCLSALLSALPACRGDPGPDRISKDATATAGSGGGGWRHGDVGRVPGRALSAGRGWP